MSWKVVVLLAAAMTVVGVAFGAPGGSGGVALCAGKGGDLSLSKKGDCPKEAKKLTIAKQGPQGEQGEQGPQGDQGTPGKDGTPADLAPEAVQLVRVATGSDNGACVNDPGRFCGNASGLCGTWQNYGSPNLLTGYRKDSGGWVHLQGTTLVDFQGACGGVASPPGIFYLPTGYRPTAKARFTVPDCNGTVNDDGVVTVGADGLVESANCVSLDGVEFHP
jgi:hypothetical protein